MNDNALCDPALVGKPVRHTWAKFNFRYGRSKYRKVKARTKPDGNDDDAAEVVAGTHMTSARSKRNNVKTGLMAEDRKWKYNDVHETCTGNSINEKFCH